LRKRSDKLPNGAAKMNCLTTEAKSDLAEGGVFIFASRSEDNLSAMKHQQPEQASQTPYKKHLIPPRSIPHIIA